MELLAGDMISACIFMTLLIVDWMDIQLNVVGRNAGPDLAILLTKAILCISRWCIPVKWTTHYIGHSLQL